jgi:hypothetical protein
MPDGRRYDNSYCWVFRFEEAMIQEVREFMDTELVTETFGADADSWHELAARRPVPSCRMRRRPKWLLVD